MKKLFKKLHKPFTVLMCCLMVFETINLTALKINAADAATSVTSGDAVSGGDVITVTSEEVIELANKATTTANSAARVYQYHSAADRVRKAEGELASAEAALASLLSQYQDGVELPEDVQNAVNAVEKAKEAIAKGWVSIQGKPIYVNFYIINRGLERPEEVREYPDTNYSRRQQGILRSGAVIDGVYQSYLEIYKQGIEITEADYSKYFVSMPDVARFGAAQPDFVLQEGEYVEWYVIKTGGDGIHVDGIIRGETTDDTDDENKDDVTNPDDNKDDNKDDNQDGNKDDVTTPDDNKDENKDENKDDVTNPDDNKDENKDENKDDVTNPDDNKDENKDENKDDVTNPDDNKDENKDENKDDVTNPDDNKDENEDENKDDVTTPDDNKDDNKDENQDENKDDVTTPDNNKDDNQNDVTTPENNEPDNSIPSTNSTPSGNTSNEEQVVPVQPTVVVADPVTAEVTETPVTELVEQQTAEVVEQPVVEITDEEAPLVDSLDDTEFEEQTEIVQEAENANSDIVVIEDEEAPLAGAGHCWIHWLILILTFVYTVYQLIRAISRDKKIKELQDETQTVEA